MTEEQKAARREYNRKWRAANPEKCSAYTKKYLKKHPERTSARRKKRYSRNKEREVRYHQKWRAANREKVREASRKWRTENPTRQRSATRTWAKNNRAKVNANERKRCATDLAYKLARRLRNRVNSAIRSSGGRKSDKLRSLIGCDVQFLMGYLEAKFTSGMKWSNYGSVWEIDHEIPCVAFDLTDPSHQRSCFHYTNLQPLFVADNRSKHDKLPTLCHSDSSFGF